jgi:hypothetical protein
MRANAPMTFLNSISILLLTISDNENKTTLELAKQIKYKRIPELQTGLDGSAGL